MSESTLKELEEYKKDMQKHMDLAEALEKLESNKHFKLLIKQGYFIDFACEQVLAKANPEIQADPTAKALNEGVLVGIGSLDRYFEMIRENGLRAKANVEQADAEMDAIRSEDV